RRALPISTLFPYTTLFRSEGKATHKRSSEPPARDGEPVLAESRNSSGGNGSAARPAYCARDLAHLRASVRHHIRSRHRADASWRDRKSTRLNSSHLGISYA